MDVVISKRILSSAIVSVLGLSFSHVSVAANNIDINADPTNTQISDDGAGNFTSNADGANLNAGDIASSWLNGDAVSVTTANGVPDSEPGIITIDSTLDFNSYTSSSLTLIALDDITINADISDSDNLSTDSLSLQLSPAANVNLNATIGEFTNTTITGGLIIGATGTYNLINVSDSLTVDSISKALGGSFNYTAGALQINDVLSIGTGELLGDALTLGVDQTLQTNDQVITSGASLTQDGGSNTVVSSLTIDAGGSYILNSGNLQAASIQNDGTMNVAGAFTVDAGNNYTQNGDLTADSINADGTMSQTAGFTSVTNTMAISDTGSYDLSGGTLVADDVTRTGNGVFTYSGGDLTLTNGTLAVEESGLLGGTVALGTGQNLYTASQSVGTVALASGTVNQTDGSNTVDGALTINTGGIYNLDGGDLNTGSVVIDGAVNQSSGVHTVAGNLAVNSLGSYDLSEGSLTSDTLSIDGSGTQSGGSNTVAGAMAITTLGDYELSAGTLDAGSLTTDGTFVQTGGANSVGGALTIEANGSYTLSDGSLSADTLDTSSGGAFTWTKGSLTLNSDTVVVDSTGLFGQSLTLDSTRKLHTANQTVGTATANSGSIDQLLSSQNTVDGTLAINEGGSYSTTRAQLEAGDVTNDGVMAQAGSSNTSISGTLNLGATGSFSMGGGRLTTVAVDNSGTITQTLGIHNVSGVLNLNTGSTYDFNNGSLSAGSMNNSGAFNQTGGSTDISGALVINGASSYSLTGGSLTAASIENSGTLTTNRVINTGSMTVGTVAPNSGMVNQSAGSVSVTGAVLVNAGGTINRTDGSLSALSITNNGAMSQANGADTSASTFTMTSGSTYDLGGRYWIPQNSSYDHSLFQVTDFDNSGAVTQSGGRSSAATLTINDGGSYTQTAGNNSLQTLNVSLGGTYDLSGDSYDGTHDSSFSGVASNNTNISGIMTQSGGHHSVGNTLTIDTSGSYLMSGGTLVVGNVDSSGTFDYTGGELTLTNSDLLVGSGGLLGDTLTIAGGQDFRAVNQAVGSTGTVNQSGGSNTATNILTIEAGGVYNFDGGTLRATNVTNLGTFNYTAGALQLTDADLNVDSSGLLGANINITAGEYFQSNNQTVGTAVVSGGSITQTGGGNQIDNTLTINAGGSYTMSGGNLSAYNIINNGSFNYTGGGVLLETGDLDISSTGLLGDTINIGTDEKFGATNMTVGTATALSGFVNQTGGTNTVTGDITINAGGNYSMSGGSLVAGSVVNNGMFNYAGGAVLLTNDNLAVDSSGLLGDTINISSGQHFGSVNQTLGTAVADSGTITQTGGFNNVQNVFTVNAGGTYNLSGTTNSNYNMLSSAQTNLSGQINQSGSTSSLGILNINNGGLYSLTHGNNYLSTLNINSGGTYDLSGGYLSFGSISNNGSFNFNSGTLVSGSVINIATGDFLGNNFTVNSGKTLRVGASVDIATGASLTVNGGYLSATTINNSGTFNFYSGTLGLNNLSVSGAGLLGQHVTLKSNRNIDVSTVTVNDGATLVVDSGQYSEITTLNNNGHTKVRNNSNLEITSAVTNTKRVTIESGSSLANHNSGGDKINFTSYTQASGITTLNGDLHANSVSIQGGQLLGAGTIEGDLTVSDGGRVKPGNSYGDLEIAGQFTLGANGTLLMEVGDDPGSVGDFLWDQLIAESYNMSGGDLNFTLQDSVSLSIFMDKFSIDDFLLIGSRDENNGYLATGLSLTSLASLNIRAYDSFEGEWNRLMLDETGGFDIYVSSVPVPAAAWLFASGLIGMAGFARRKAA